MDWYSHSGSYSLIILPFIHPGLTAWVGTKTTRSLTY